jgi:UDP-N-acetylglucosamine:LPS N-acetylglucosamine transferase
MTTPTTSPINSAASQDGGSSAEEVVAYCVAMGLIAIPDGGHQREFSADELLKLKLARVLIENVRLLEILSKTYVRLNKDGGIEINADRIAANEKHTLNLVQLLLKKFPESTFQLSE